MREELNKIAIFRGKEVRQIVYQNEWWFSITDIIEALTGNERPRKYWNDLKKKLKEEGSEVSEKIGQLKMEASDGKQYLTDAANTETVFRLIQSIPSPKAEPFKRWLAKVGYERIQEIDDPELGMKRTRALYIAKGYSESWIEMRMRGIVIRDELTDEWKNRGADGQIDYAILTAEISKATFGVTPSEYKKLKGLKRENLRDHMDDFELIFNTLGERATTEIHRHENSKGLPKLKSDAKAGGDIAGGARTKLEKRLGRSLVTPRNHLKDKNKEIKN